MKSIVVYNGKGGVGKTLLSTQLSIYLAGKGWTLLVDTDPLHSATVYMGQNGNPGMVGLLESGRVEVIETAHVNLDILTSGYQLESIRIGKPEERRFAKIFQSDYEHIVIDTIGTIGSAGSLIGMVLRSDIDILIIPVVLDHGSINGLKYALSNLKTRPPIVLIVPNMVHRGILGPSGEAKEVLGLLSDISTSQGAVLLSPISLNQKYRKSVEKNEIIKGKEFSRFFQEVYSVLKN